MSSLFLTQKFIKKEDKVSPHFTYYHNGKKTKIFVGVTCFSDDWNKEKKKVKRTDKDYKLKNLKIDTIRTKLEKLVNRYKANDEILSTDQIKLELKKKEIVKEVKSITSLPAYNLIQEWLKSELNDEVKMKSTRDKTKQMTKDILDFIIEKEKDQSTLLIDDLDDTFSRDFMVWLFNKEHTKNGKKIIGLSPNSVSRRYVALNQFAKWYSKTSKEYFKISRPSELTKSVSIKKGEDKSFLYNEELEKVYNFRDFDYRKPIVKKDGKIEWVENDDIHKHLKQRGNTHSKDKEGVVYEILDKTKNGFIPYTTYEVYKDIFVFLCSVGCRYSDGIRMKLENFYHGKRTTTSNIEGGVEGFWKFYQQKTKTEAIPRVNEVSFEIYKKYSRGKSKSDYLFPLTESGNFISDVKFNKHIKKICKIIGLNRQFVQRKLGIGGKEISRDFKKLHEVIESHSGRRTYIYNMVIDGNYTNNELMTMTGHKKTDVFLQYFKLKEEIHKKPIKPFIKLHNVIIESNEEVQKLNVDDFFVAQKNKSLKDKLKELEEAKEFLSDKEYKKKREEILNNPF